MPIIIKPKSFNHWLEMKAEDVSSTEVSCLFGLSPYSTEFELFHTKKAGEIQEIPDNERMKWGRRSEDMIAQGIGEDFNMKVRRLKIYARHDTCKKMSSSFDYEIVGDYSESNLMKINPNLKGAGLLEIKNVDGWIFRQEWEDDEAPAHIEAQVQHQMEVMNRDWTLIVALVGGNKGVAILRERNREVGKAMCDRIDRFWREVDQGVEPMPNFSKDKDFIISMYKTVEGEPLDMTGDEGLKALVRSYKELQDRYNLIDKATNAIKAEVVYRVGAVPKLFSDDGLTVNLAMTKGSLPTPITQDMVGTEIGGRKSWRQFRITQKKVK